MELFIKTSSTSCWKNKTIDNEAAVEKSEHAVTHGMINNML